MTDDASSAPALTLDAVLGFEVVEAGSDRALGRFAVEDRVCQPYGLVHGGAYAAIAESLAARATAAAVSDAGMEATGLSTQTSFLKPATSGWVTSEARCRHRGRTTWVWDVDHSDDAGRLCATTRVTIAVSARG